MQFVEPNFPGLFFHPLSIDTEGNKQASVLEMIKMFWLELLVKAQLLFGGLDSNMITDQ